MTILDLDKAKQMDQFKAIAEPRLATALAAANGWVEARIRPRPTTEIEAPADLVQAVALLTNRYLAREQSADGFVGMAETGAPAYIGRVDPDVQSLIGPYRRVVFS